MSHSLQIKILIGLLVMMALLPLLGSRYLLELGSQIMIWALLAMSLNILVGYVGAISFGHAAFFAIGGYSCVYLHSTLGVPLGLAFPAAVGLSGLAAAIIGYFCVKLNDIYFAMLSLAFSMLVWAVALKWRSVTGGDDGFVGADIPIFLQSPTVFFFFVLGVVSISIIAMWVLVNSTMGRTFVAIRENQVRARFLGVNVRKVRLIAFIIAGCFAGVAGALFSLYLRGMYPESAFWSQSGQILIMVLLGGMTTFIGPIVGATILYLLEVFINQYTEHWQIVLGLILLAIVMLAPEGITGLSKASFVKIFKGRR